MKRTARQKRLEKEYASACAVLQHTSGLVEHRLAHLFEAMRRKEIALREYLKVAKALSASDR